MTGKARDDRPRYPHPGLVVAWRPAAPCCISDHIEQHEATGLGASAISCWEVAKLIEVGRLTLPVPTGDWLVHALSYPGVLLFELPPRIAVESTQLPGTFHRDPADQPIVATARTLNCPLVTLDVKILEYSHVHLGP